MAGGLRSQQWGWRLRSSTSDLPNGRNTHSKPLCRLRKIRKFTVAAVEGTAVERQGWKGGDAGGGDHLRIDEIGKQCWVAEHEVLEKKEKEDEDRRHTKFKAKRVADEVCNTPILRY
ncbi:unnamed protein product [Lactuca virosa]|uniref:Uncharacterized protein n=1 Tax=Lactuca virosa TaxID=75947 RepID=A0AAU9P5U9_9ASTR|nr:unnamed protein product [Lactuca virosa]